MSREILFWVLMLFWLVLGLWVEYVPNQPYPFKRVFAGIVPFLVLCVLGWQVFGAPVK